MRAVGQRRSDDRRVEVITKVLWGMRVSPLVVSALNQNVYGKIQSGRYCKIEGQHFYAFLDGIRFKITWAVAGRIVAALVAIGVDAEGHQ